MASSANPFLGRMSERATSDQEFVQLFSPKILEKLPDESFKGAVHIFRSPPGGGKTTLLRAFTPTALRAIWNTRKLPDLRETYQNLLDRDIFDNQDGAQLLGVLLTCASGYADLPPGASIKNEGLFRALLDCRIVMRALRNLASLLGYSSTEKLDNITIEYTEVAKDLKSIPQFQTVNELVEWAEQRERSVYAHLDSFANQSNSSMPTDVRFEGVIWLQEVKFIRNNKEVAPRRLLMIDDLHKLRQKQHELLIDELTTIRSPMPIWLAERNIALKEGLLSQGVREGRDLKEYALDNFWNTGQGKNQFLTFAQNILERRFYTQNLIPPPFFSYLRQELQLEEIQDQINDGISKFFTDMDKYKNNDLYSDWFKHAEEVSKNADHDALIDLITIRILVYRNEGKKQLTLGFTPLTHDEMESRDSSSVKNAAEFFIHEETKIPYYFGTDRLCVLSSNNVEELLTIAAELYEGLLAKKVLRKVELILSPQEQEKYIKIVAKRKRDFIPKTHTHGTRAQFLLDNIGYYCRERTFLPNAPYAPGVTGVRLSQQELLKLHSTTGPRADDYAILRKVLSECVAENLLVSHSSSVTTSREGGTIFYLNRTLCAYYKLPLQKGGWQDVRLDEVVNWMNKSVKPKSIKDLEIA